MRALLYARPGMAHQDRAMQALGEGMARHGIESVVRGDYIGAEQADFIACWGDKVPEYLMHKPRLILESGYINGQSGDYVRDRLQFVSVGWNGLHGRADAWPPECPPDRWEALGIELAEWAPGNEHILICDQHPGDTVAPVNRQWWKPAAALAVEIGVRAILRPHPLLASNQRPLRDAMRDAIMVVTWSSTSGIETVLGGIPTIAMDRGSMVSSICSHYPVAEPLLSDRQQWAYDLAYRQWGWDELANGTAWEYIWQAADAIN